MGASLVTHGVAGIALNAFGVYLEAAIGIEPMIKGFADRLGLRSLNATDYHTLIIAGFSAWCGD